VDAGTLTGRMDLINGGIRLCVADIKQNGSIEDVWILYHHANSIV
jgi:hypothetical protein